MPEDENEEELLRSVALRNAQSILLARQRAEQELLQAKEALELRTEELAKSLATLRAILDSTTDGILATDDNGKVTEFNRKFVEMWRMPREALESREHRQLLEVFACQINDPEQFRLKVDDIYANSPPESYDLLELADGRVFERHSQIQRVDQRNVGRVWSFRDITERRRAEESLRTESEWLRITLASIADAVITTDTRGYITSINPVGESLTGWAQQEAQGKPLNHVFRAINEQSRQLVENPTIKALREGHVTGLANHSVLVHRDGTERAVDDSAAPIRDDRGNIVGAVLIFRDVTEARRATELQHRLSAIVESSDDAIISKNLDSIIVSWNKAAERLYGYTAEEVIGKPLAILVPPDHPDELPDIMERLKRGERISHFETQRVRKDGTRVDVSLTISPVRRADGKIIGASKIARDVTARKQAEQRTRFLADASAALAELTDYESTLRKVASLAVPFFADWCAVDMLAGDSSLRRLAVTHLDPAKEELVRELERLYPDGASDGHGIMQVVRRGNPEWALEISDSLVTASAHDDQYLSLLRKSGLKSYICVPLKSRTRVLGTLTFVMAESGRVYDIDDVRAAEDLADRAVIAIENAHLLATLKESDRRKDEFLAMLAHELRNPLAPIRNAVQLLHLKGPPNPDLQWARDVIDRQVQQMARLVDDLLDVSRITRGKIELRRERVELVAAVNSALETSRPLIKTRGHELTVTLPPEPIHLYADPTRLAQVLSNLLNNAAKYTDEGGRIWLTVERQNDQVLVRVKDTGIGIPTEMLAHIFEIFSQVDRSLERSEGGLGIGLTLVKRLVEMHGGTVEALSAGPGTGSEFVLRIPVAAPEVKEPTSPEAGGYGQTAAPLTCRVLVVDDNQDSAESIAMLLRTLGNEVRTAHDGWEAVEAAAAFQPNLVLLDIGLPKLNGFEAARRIRELPSGGDIMLIALTGWGQEEHRRRSKEAGFDHHLTKPVDFRALQDLLAATQLRNLERRSAKPGN
jgi:PAS domain S-box-containing protein